ncbi:TPA: CRISPR-associated helicase Cas3' [Candidatus Poribacteria bacterium]|nr:CRISPR-associated helicase Cas3' [Candidatus Poribacteria bacterium]
MAQIEFYSHLDKKTMQKHLSEVMGYGVRSVSQLPPRFSQNDGFKSLVMISCLCHDFGKFTSFFQKYLFGDKRQGSKSNHGFISALFTAFQIKNYSPKILTQIDQYLPLIAYLCVLHHHGNLENLDEDIIRKGKLDNPTQLNTQQATNIKNVEVQISDLLKNKITIEKIYNEIYPDQIFSIDSFSNSWRDLLKDLDIARHIFENRENDENKRLVFIYLLLLYSIIIDSDKKSAGEIEIVSQRKLLSDSLVDSYKKDCPFPIDPSQEKIDKAREEIYEKVNKTIENISLDKHIMTLTAPTGTGKTLSVLSVALKLRDRIEKEKGYTPRIIYSLPFTSIIDQNFEVIKKVLSKIEEYSNNPGEYLLKHHYLSNAEYKKDGEEMESRDAELLTESWETEIVVTTFVQLLQTIIGFRNKHLKKYHKLAGSIILLDEVQNIDVEYWQLISNSLKLLCKALDCYIILLTATKPLLFDEKECYELLQDHEKYFRSFKRTRIIADIEVISLDDLIEKFKEIYDERLSFLIVANTIKSSIYIYQKIKENSFITAPKYYLSSNIVHKYRKQRIDEISNALESKQKPILVSTQVVEAGVDLDFDRVIRDLGPVDSIVQVAGRCNRSWKRPTSEVYVFNVKDDQERSLASYVYGALSVNAVKSAISEGIYDEEKYYELVDRFFKNVKSGEAEKRSKEIWDAITNLRFCSHDYPSVSDFALIESLPFMVDVFVQADDKAVTLWNRYENEVLKERDFRKRISNFAKIKSEFHSYIISVPKELAKELVTIDRAERFYLLPYEAIDQYYDKDTGFKRIPEDKTWIL